MIERTQILEGLQQLKALLQKKFYLIELALFGSNAREDYKADSDIDLMIDFLKNTHLIFLV